MGGDSITFQYRYRKQILIGILLILILGVPAGFFGYQKIMKNTKKDIKKEVIPLEKKESKTAKVEILDESYKVDIKGQIINPGIYTLKKDSRVIDVINLAGGLTENADTSVINLSKKISDEMVIIVYSIEEVKNFEQTKEKEQQVQEKCEQVDENALQNDACITTATAENKEQTQQKVSINKATKEELMTLPGVGESKAKDIIDYREKNGPFTTIEDLKNVSGIGESILAKIKDNIIIE